MEPKTANFILATWVLELLSGNNCLGNTLRSSTIKQYLEAAQDLMVEGGYGKKWQDKHGLPLDEVNAVMSKPVMANLRRWESVPKRREMFTDDMHEEFYQRAIKSAEHSLERCFYDWLALGRYTGYRLSEWAQTRKHSYERISATDSRAKAMIDEDLLFFDNTGKLLQKIPSNEPKIARLDVRWRVQKNAQNNEVISFWRDDIEQKWCPVRAAWRICQRARTLNQPLEEPLGKYVDYKTKRIAYINNTEAEILIREVARICTGIMDPKVLAKLFGMHSMRVTACNELSRLGVPDSFIKRRLRWRSETFLDYLRNNIHTAQRHNLSLNLRVPPQDVELAQNLRAHTQDGRSTQA